MASPWTAELKELVRALWPDHSATMIANIIKRDHGITFSRNAVIGVGHRMGLMVSGATTRIRVPRQKPVQRKPKLHVVANGSGGYRLQETVTGELPLLRCIELPPLNLSLADLPENGCRYIAGDDSLYCGHVRRDGSSYCEPHHRLVWLPAKPHKPSAMRRHAA
jgi:GcrA cell cycle regulator